LQTRSGMRQPLLICYLQNRSTWIFNRCLWSKSWLTIEVNPLKHGEGISESNWGDNLVHADAKGLHIPSYLATSYLATYLSSYLPI
jgi:hypothetical protein